MFNNGNFEAIEFIPDDEYINSLNFIVDWCYTKDMRIFDYLVEYLLK